MIKRTIEVPEILYRTGTTVIDQSKGTVRLSISSDQPYLRWDWRSGKEFYEVLDHSSGLDASRLRIGTSLLYNHDRNILLGRNTFVGVMDNKAVVDALISKAPDVESYRVKIEEGILCDSSVGYTVDDEGEEIGEKDGIPIIKVKWMPHEASLVTIPADQSVGIGRDHNPAWNVPVDGKPKLKEIAVKKYVDATRKNENNESNQGEHSQESEKTMKRSQSFREAPNGGGGGGNGTAEIDVVAERKDAESKGVAGERKRINDIGDLAKHFAEKGLAGRKIDTHETASQFIRDGKTAAEFKDHVVMNEFPEVKERVAVPDPKIGMSRKERKQFSLCKAILEEAMAHRGHGPGLTGIEKDACETSAKHLQKIDGTRSFGGMCIPDDVLTASFAEDQELSADQMRSIAQENHRLKMLLRTTPLNAGTFASGGALIATELLAGSLIDLLRNAALIGQGPLAITELGGLVGNVAIPKHTAAGTVYWMAEGASVTESEVTFGQLVLSPKRMGADTAYTKQLLAQASLSVEAFVREDIAVIMAIEEDRVILFGAGVGGEPLGIANTTGVGADVTFSGNATWVKMVAFEAGLENANVRNGQMAILTSPTSKQYMKTTPKLGTTFPIYVWEKNDMGYPVINGVMPGVVNDYPAYATKQMSTNAVLQGKFSEIVKARWAGFDVVVDPYTGKKSETIEITVHQWMDVGIRHPQAFELSTDAPTSP